MKNNENEQVNHPSHYQTLGIEVLDMMKAIWGIDAVMQFCAMNAFKYRMRAGHKGDAQQDINKALWYERTMQNLSKQTFVGPASDDVKRMLKQVHNIPQDRSHETD